MGLWSSVRSANALTWSWVTVRHTVDPRCSPPCRGSSVRGTLRPAVGLSVMFMLTSMGLGRVNVKQLDLEYQAT